VTALSEPTPVHDEARSDADRHAAALTPVDHRQWGDLAAELARPHPARLRRLLEGLADPAAALPNDEAARALERLFPADGDLDPERLRAAAATLGCELASVGEVLRGWLLVGAISQGLLPEGAVAEAMAEERERLATLARWLRELAGTVLSEETVVAFLALLPDDVLASAFDDDNAPSEQAPPYTDVRSPALDEPPEGADGPQTPEEAIPHAGGTPDAERAAEGPLEPGDGFYTQRADDAAFVAEQATEPDPSEAPTVVEERDDWPAALLADPDATQAIDPPAETVELHAVSVPLDNYADVAAHLVQAHPDDWNHDHSHRTDETRELR
jgi:hypothetical protein